MSPRRHHRRPDAGSTVDSEKARRGSETVQAWSDGDWMVRTIPGGSAGKTYRCPGCDQEIRAGLAHVVAWPADTGSPEDRRHWHSSCWQARERRAPKIQRSRGAPRHG